MEQNSYIPLLGLALRGGRLAAGADAVEAAAREHKARLLLTSADAPERIRRARTRLAQEAQCMELDLPCGKEELGHALGRGDVSILALTDTGLAAAVGRRLAALDPERYGEASARLDLKERRAKERKQTAPLHSTEKRRKKASALSHARGRPAKRKPTTDNKRGR